MERFKIVRVENIRYLKLLFKKLWVIPQKFISSYIRFLLESLALSVATCPYITNRRVKVRKLCNQINIDRLMVDWYLWTDGPLLARQTKHAFRDVSLFHLVHWAPLIKQLKKFRLCCYWARTRTMVKCGKVWCLYSINRSIEKSEPNTKNTISNRNWK